MEIIYSKDIFKESGIYNVNMLYRKENVYLMDNHLSALWCWVKHRQEKIIIGNPQIIHVDHHNDYEEVPNNKETRKAVSKICKQTFEQFISELNENNNKRYNWSNYIQYFIILEKEALINFYTCDDEIQEYEMNEIPMILDEDLFCHENLIFNIDIDTFFMEHQDEKYQIYSNRFIEKVGSLIKELKENNRNACITIAMSPEWCGGWKNALDVTESINEHGQLGFDINEIRRRVLNKYL